MRAVFQAHLPAAAAVWLFGSRADLNARGGDIDLFVKTAEALEPLALVRRLRIALQMELGERKIDIVVQTPGQQSALYDIAEAEGVLLWTGDNASELILTNS